MARQRYVGVSGAIGPGGLLAAATSHTLAAPLTYGNGQTVPSLTGSNHFLLTLCDSFGNPVEVVRVTGYSSSTGAISAMTRGQEGTTAANRAAGDKVTMGSYPSDLTSSSEASVAVVPTLKTTQAGTGTAVVTVPAGVTTADTVIVSESNTATAAAPSGGGWTTLVSYSTASGAYFGSGVNVYSKTGLQAGDTFTVTSGGAFVVEYWSGVTGVGGGGVGQVGNNGTNVGVPVPSPAPHQVVLLALGFTTDTVQTPVISVGTLDVSSISGNLGGYEAGTAINHATGGGVTAGASGSASHWNGVMSAIVLSGTPATGYTQTFTEQVPSSVPTPQVGQAQLFVDTDHRVKRKTQAGSTVPVEAGTVKAFDLSATAGDEFAGASLDAKWTRVTYAGADEQYAQGGDTTWLQVDTSKAVGSYYYETVSIAGDLLLQAGISAWRSTGQMFGLLAVDGSGNGMGACPYNTPDAMFLTSIAAMAYGGSSQQVGAGLGYTSCASGQLLHHQLRRVSGAWSARFSLNGRVWSPWTSTLADARTITRIGFGGWLASTPPFAVDYFDRLV